MAIKLYTPFDITVESIVKYQREVSLLSTLEHPNIVKYLGISVIPPHVALVFELCVRGGLGTQLRPMARQFPLSQRLFAMHTMAKAIAFMHSKDPPCIHRGESRRTPRSLLLAIGDESCHAVCVRYQAG